MIFAAGLAACGVALILALVRAMRGTPSCAFHWV